MSQKVEIQVKNQSDAGISQSNKFLLKAGAVALLVYYMYYQVTENFLPNFHWPDGLSLKFFGKKKDVPGARFFQWSSSAADKTVYALEEMIFKIIVPNIFNYEMEHQPQGAQGYTWTEYAVPSMSKDINGKPLPYIIPQGTIIGELLEMGEYNSEIFIYKIKPHPNYHFEKITDEWYTTYNAIFIAMNNTERKYKYGV